MEKSIYSRLRAAKTAYRRNLVPESSMRDERRSISSKDSIDQLSEFSITELAELLIDDGIISEVVQMIGQGKEANVYWIRDMSGKNLALKMFRIHTTSHNFNSLHARSKLSDTGKLSIATGLCLQEYLNLHYLYDAEVLVPRPHERHEFIFLMEYLGTDKGPAPLLRDVNLVDLGYDPIDVLETILEDMYIMFNNAEMVHGDFSEHNIVWFQEQPWIIDVLQSQRYHPRYHTDERIRKRDALPTLYRDVKAILNYFRKKYHKTFEFDAVIEEMVEEKIEDWLPDELMSENFDHSIIPN